MNSSDGISGKLNVLAERGIVAGVSASGTLRVCGASLLTPDEQKWFRAHAGAILAHLASTAVTNSNFSLSGKESWDQSAALQMMHDADGLVERLGIDGRHPAVESAAAMVVSAFATHDLETVHFAVVEFEVAVRQVALQVRCQKRDGFPCPPEQKVLLSAQEPGVPNATSSH